MLKFQVSLQPSIELPVISETLRMVSSGRTKKTPSQSAVGRLSRYGTRPRLSFCAHDWMIGSNVEVHSS